MGRQVTVDQVMAWCPCAGYDRARVESLWSGREALTAREIAALDIPVRDRLWAVLREEMIPETALRLLAADYAERALMRERAAGREPDARSWAAIEAIRRYARGEIGREDLHADAAAAADAAYYAAAAAAAAAAAYYAAYYAAAYYAYYAAAAAAGAAHDESEWQLAAAVERSETT